MVAWFVLLFAGAYAWLARQPEIDRPLVGFAAIGKAGAFSIFAACWILGQLSGRATLAGTGDLIFAAIFAWWLIGSGTSAPLASSPRPLAATDARVSAFERMTVSVLV
jgi:hypothetical protein